MHRDAAPADVLAAVAARLGAPWDGPGDASRADVDLPDGVPGWEVLDATREALVAADPVVRRSLGAHHTPFDLARRLAELALDGHGGDAIVADPACGGGAFLIAAAELLVERGADRGDVVRHQLVGVDVDPLAVATTRAALALWSGVGAEAAGVVRADGLGPWRPPASVDVVLGNPPFRSPLAAGAPAGELGAYTDLAGRFLVAALLLAQPDGSVLLVQPESVLAARDAGPVRAAVGRRLAGLWVAGEPVFGAEVRVCAPLVRMGREHRRVARWAGADVRPAGSAAVDRATSTWAYLRPGGPPPSAARTNGTLADLATATAGFRDEFYALAAAAADGGAGAPLVTSGLIDPGRLRWGEAAARIGGRRFERPTVDVAALDGAVRRWVEARLAPKVLVATQTRVIEAVADPDGSTVPLTPVVAVHPRDPADVWRIAAALTSPAATAWALRLYGGTGLHPDALKLSSSQLLAVPLPADDDAWAEATALLRDGDAVGCGAVLADGELLKWWRARLPRRLSAPTS